MAVRSSFNFYILYRPSRRRREGRLRTLHDPMLAFLESLEFLEILRLLKFEDIITMVRSHVGSATPPSVMVLFILSFIHSLPFDKIGHSA